MAVLVAAAGWYTSLDLLKVTGGAAAGPLVQAVCGGGSGAHALDDCTSVLTSPHAYVPISRDPSAPKMPVSAFGMGYFAFVALWYLLVGPPTHNRRHWHLLIAAVVLAGAWQSLEYIGIMKYTLHRWCGGCLAAHALNGGIVVLTILAYPWRERVAARSNRFVRAARTGGFVLIAGHLAAFVLLAVKQATLESYALNIALLVLNVGAWPWYRRTSTPHPSARLVGAAALAGGLSFALHLAIVSIMIAGTILKQRTDQYAAVLDEPAYIQWDFHRQPVVSIPLEDDELFAGDPAAPNTLVVFGDFQCTICRQLHETLRKAADKHPGKFRVAFRYYPQDPECNPNPAYRSGGHPSACRAARAVEAVRVVGGSTAYFAMRQKLWDGQDQLPRRPYVQQSERERKLFEEWAVEIGLDRAAFVEAMDSPGVATRIQADIDLATRLGLQAMPVVYVNGRLLRGWSKPETWDAILGGKTEPATQPTSAPVAH